MSNPQHCADLLSRINRLSPDSPRKWGRMDAPQMIAHLIDQMALTLGDQLGTPQPGPLRWAPVRYLVIYWLPWPRGKIEGPPEAFITKPFEWEADIASLKDLVNRFEAEDPNRAWPEHVFFGPMRGDEWGHFCYRHFDHHLTQFGV